MRVLSKYFPLKIATAGAGLEWMENDD